MVGDGLGPGDEGPSTEGQLLKSICNYRRLRLTEGKRSCQALFDLYSSFSTIGSRYHLSLAEMIEVARHLPNRGYADVNLTISHGPEVSVVSAA